MSLRYFGPDTHADLPKVGDHMKERASEVTATCREDQASRVRPS